MQTGEAVWSIFTTTLGDEHVAALSRGFGIKPDMVSFTRESFAVHAIELCHHLTFF